MDGEDFVLNSTIDDRPQTVKDGPSSTVHRQQSIKKELQPMLLASTQVQTIIREVSADLETPVSLYLKLRGDGASFLLESVEGGERIARYSFIGVQPRAQYILRDGQIEIKENNNTRVIEFHDDPTRFLQEEMSRFSTERLPNAPRFTGGLVGYLGYESVRYFEPTLKPRMNRASFDASE